MKAHTLSALGVISVLAGCAPAGPEAPTTLATTPLDSAVSSTPDVSAASATADAVEASAPAAADTHVRDACNKLCERVAGSCPKGRGEACLAQCANHEARSKGCEAEAEAALSCQLKVADSFCNNVVAQSCQDAFVRMQRCQKGESQTTTVSRNEPDGWKRVSDDVWGVSIVMPASAALDSQAKWRTWKASQEGTTYEVVEIARPKKLEPQAMIKLVLAHVGIGCQKEMRLSGQVDTDKVTFTRFETSCSTGKRMYGKLWIDEKRVLSLIVRDEAKTEDREAFLDSIK